jgi:hypothetical protein
MTNADTANVTCRTPHRLQPLLLVFVSVVLYVSPAPAWNALGHRVVAETAWQQLPPERRQQIVDTLRHHPRFAEDFVAKMPSNVSIDDKEAQDRWIFWQAAVWPDVARRGPFDRPTWHYINRPIFIGPERPVSANLSIEYPGDTPIDQLNCIQATKLALGTISDEESGLDAKALAYCWLFHLVGDMHQPLHSTALFCDYFPDGDKGGSILPTMQMRNLHALWDGWLGTDDSPARVIRESQELTRRRELWNVDTTATPEHWIAEGHNLAKLAVYTPDILDKVSRAKPDSPLLPFIMSDDYLKAGGESARQRIVEAGMRLGAILKR